MTPNEQGSMHWFRRPSTIWLTCMVAFAMPLQAVTATACQCVRNTGVSTNSEIARVDASPVPMRYSCCSPQPAAGTYHAGSTETAGCRRCQRSKCSSPCGCGDDCLCSLLVPKTSPPALPPTPSSRSGEELVKLQALAHRVTESGVPPGPSSSQYRASAERFPQTKLDFCATFCRLLL